MAYINLSKSKERRTITSRVRDYQKIYQDSKWKALRDLKFRKNPVCEECESNGVTSVTEEIHHIIRFADGLNDREIKILAFSYSNLMSLCISCHKLKHQRYKIDYDLRKKLLKY